MKPFVLAAIVLATPLAAQAPNWTKGAPLSITVTNQGFTPARIVLKSGAQYTLTFRNRSDRAHNFAARKFFDVARVSPRDQAWVAHDEIKLDAGQSAVVHIVAPAMRGASFDFRSTHLADAGGKMKGVIYIR